MPDLPRLSDEELERYVEGRLDPLQRADAHARLAAHPDQAARVAADLEAKAGLQTLYGAEGEPRQAHLELGELLQDELARTRKRRAAMRRSAAAGLVIVGVLSGVAMGDRLDFSPFGPPDYVVEAEQAHRTTLLRAVMRSQLETTTYNPDEIQAATRISLPEFPAGWRLRDVQVYPAAAGPSVEVAFAVEAIGAVSLYATRTNDHAYMRPTLSDRPGGVVVYWQLGDQAYALTGDDPAKAALLTAAEDLFPDD